MNKPLLNEVPFSSVLPSDSKSPKFPSVLFTDDTNRGPGSSVGIATERRDGRSGIESRWGREFTPVQTDPEAHQASCTMGTGSFPGVKCGRGVLLTTHPPSSAGVMEE